MILLGIRFALLWRVCSEGAAIVLVEVLLAHRKPRANAASAALSRSKRANAASAALSRSKRALAYARLVRDLDVYITDLIDAHILKGERAGKRIVEP